MNTLYLSAILLALNSVWPCVFAQKNAVSSPNKIMVESVNENASVNAKWLAILTTRNQQPYNSTATLTTHLSLAEGAWLDLIVSRKASWVSLIDSLAEPFSAVRSTDVCILVGSHGIDDAFTFGDNTICLDLSVMAKSYGNAESKGNSERLDRIFAHEMTHLFHKAWMRRHHVQLVTFKDSVLWECIYEGLGTYRSLSEKWLGGGQSLPTVTKEALSLLLPEFLTNIDRVCNSNDLDASQKASILKSLSRGSINRKWGAFTVAVLIRSYTSGNSKKLKKIINWGINSAILLAMEYPELNGESRQKLLSCLAR